MASYDDGDEYDCPAPYKPGRGARAVNRALGMGLANVWLTLLVAVARLAHLVPVRRRAADLARSAQVAARDPRTGKIGDDLARARRVYG